MSDSYEFLSLSETEEMESPSEGTMALVLDEGAVKRVPVSQFGGGAGSYVVTVTTADMVDWTADKTYAEIVAAIENGAVPVACLDLSVAFGGTAKVFAPLFSYTAGADADEVTFELNSNSMSGVVVMIGADGSVYVECPMGEE